MKILAVDAAGARAGVAVVGADGAVLAQAFAPGRPGLIETLPGLLRDCLAGREVGLVAVTVGPGSFTGLRTTLALAQGYAEAAGVEIAGVTVGEAFAAGAGDLRRPLWVAVRARAGRIFLVRDGVAEGFEDTDLPRASGPVAVAGDAANVVAAWLAAAGTDVLLTNARMIEPAWVAWAAVARRSAGLAPHLPLPVYVDPPAAKLPAAGLRPAPV